MSEKTIIDLSQKNRWAEAIMLSAYVNPLMYNKIVENYLERYADGNPFYTFLLLNQCKAEQVFIMNPGVFKNWNKHLGFLLMNIEYCNSKALTEFLRLLLTKLQEVFKFN